MILDRRSPVRTVAVSVVFRANFRAAMYRRSGIGYRLTGRRGPREISFAIRGSRSARAPRAGAGAVRSRAHPLPHERAKRGQNRGSCCVATEPVDVGRRHVATQSRVTRGRGGARGGGTARAYGGAVSKPLSVANATGRDRGPGRRRAPRIHSSRHDAVAETRDVYAVLRDDNRYRKRTTGTGLNSNET